MVTTDNTKEVGMDQNKSVLKQFCISLPEDFERGWLQRVPRLALE